MIGGRCLGVPRKRSDHAICLRRKPPEYGGYVTSCLFRSLSRCRDRRVGVLIAPTGSKAKLDKRLCHRQRFFMLASYWTLVAANAPISTCLLWRHAGGRIEIERNVGKERRREGIAAVSLHGHAHCVCRHYHKSQWALPRVPGKASTRTSTT